jgi:hypothetical protein
VNGAVKDEHILEGLEGLHGDRRVGPSAGKEHKRHIGPFRPALERRSEGRERPFGLERLIGQENRPHPEIELAANVHHVCTNRHRNSGARQDFARGPSILVGWRNRKDLMLALRNSIH